MRPTATHATLTTGTLALGADELPLPHVRAKRVGEDVDRVEPDRLGLPNTERRALPRLRPGGVDETELHGSPPVMCLVFRAGRETGWRGDRPKARTKHRTQNTKHGPQHCP